MKTSRAIGVMLATLALSTVVAVNAEPIYGGTITQTVLQTNDPDYHVGQVFHGYYRYTSPNGDADTDPDDPSLRTEIDFMVYSTLPGRDGVRDFNDATHAHFAVTNGTISSFYYVIGDEWRIFSLDGGGFYSMYERWMEEPPQSTIYTEATCWSRNHAAWTKCPTCAQPPFSSPRSCSLGSLCDAFGKTPPANPVNHEIHERHESRLL